MSGLYRANRRYSNGAFSLDMGGVYALDPDAAGLVERDSAGTLTALTDDETTLVADALAEASSRTGVPIRADWRPGPPRGPATSPTAGSAMHTGDSGLVPR